MSFRIWTQLFLISILVALLGRIGMQQLNHHQNRVLTTGLCRQVAFDLETGSLRKIQEGLKQSLLLVGKSDACVMVTDAGSSFSPGCLDQTKTYQTEICRAENNENVQASVLYPDESFWNEWVFILFAVAFLTLTVATLMMIRFTSMIFQVFSSEVTLTFESTDHARAIKPISQIAQNILKGIGVLGPVFESRERFQERVEDYEKRLAEQLVEKIKKEQEAALAQEYIDKIKDIQHDIRSPIASLQAVRDALRGDPEADRTLYSAINRIETMLDRLGETGGIREVPKLVVAEIAVDDAIHEVRPKFETAKGVTVNFGYDINLLSPLLIGRDDLSSIIDNLLQNAFDAVGSDGRIVVRVRSELSNCVISVEDNGAGIPEDVAPKIFQSGGTFGKLNGQGLGLHQVKKKVEAWKGKIEFERLALGTRFIVTLPLVQTGVQFIDPRSLGMAINVVDDDATIVETLSSAGFSVKATALTFPAGRELIHSISTPQLPFLIDYRLGRNEYGTDLIKEFRGHGQFVLCTNDYDNLEVIKKARECGVKIVPKSILFMLPRPAKKS